RVGAIDRFGERVAKLVARVRDGIPGVVPEEPEGVALAEPGIGDQIVDHVGPARRARGRAVHEYHWEAARLVGAQRNERARPFDAERVAQEYPYLLLPEL